MPKKVVPLSDAKLRNAKPKDKSYKLFDGGGLYLLVDANGSKRWQMKITFANKANTLSFGVYPIVSLEAARAKRLEAKRQIDQGINPSLAKKAQRDTVAGDYRNTFESVALDWHAYKTKSWSEDRSKLILSRLNNHVFKVIGSKAIKNLVSKDFFDLLSNLHATGTTFTANALLGNLKEIMSYAVVNGKCEQNSLYVVSDTINLKHEGKKMAAFIKPADIGELIRRIESYSGSVHVTSALILLSRTFARPGEVRFARWKDVNLKSGWWSVPSDQKKERRSMDFPLSTQVVKHLTFLKKLTGKNEYVFESPQGGDKPICENAMNNALKTLGYNTQTEMTGHGFRAMARTFLDQEVGFDERLIEFQLAHKVSDDLNDTYNRSDYREVRVSMMQCWSDCLDQMRDNKNVINYVKRNKKKYKTKTGALHS